MIYISKIESSIIFQNPEKPHILKNCNKVRPALVFIIGKTIIKNGRENIYLPANAIKIANKIETTIIDDLIVFATLFVELFANQLRNK